jgi:hypothetical protein
MTIQEIEPNYKGFRCWVPDYKNHSCFEQLCQEGHCSECEIFQEWKKMRSENGRNIDSRNIGSSARFQ